MGSSPTVPVGHVAPGNEEFDTLANAVAADLRRAADP